MRVKILYIDGTRGFSPTRLGERPCGGILTSLTIIPRGLAKYGYDVTVLSLHEKAETVEGVQYKPLTSDLQLLGKQDIVVFNRNCIDRRTAQYFKNQGAHIVWWLHDIVDPRYLQDDGYMLADTVVALSRYCRQSYADFYRIPYDKFVLIPNGVDKSVFRKDANVRRRENLFVTASAPIKGLYPLGFAWHNIRRALPNAEMRLYSSQKLHELENSKEQDAQLTSLAAMGVTIMEPVSQKDLASVFQEATALLMPNSYPEICSNVLLQAQACGLPVVARSIGSVPEFIEHRYSGLLTETKPHDMFWWHKDFAEQCVTLIEDKGLAERISINCDEGVRDWDYVSGLWAGLVDAVTASEVA